MSLASRCAYAFSSGSTERGERYFRDGRVSLRAVDAYGASAEVRGDGPTPYRVALEWPDSAGRRDLAVACTCAQFADGFYCKHIYAAILAVDENPPAQLAQGTRILKVVPLAHERSSALAAGDLDERARGGGDRTAGGGETTGITVWERGTRTVRTAPRGVTPAREAAARWRTRLRAIEAGATPTAPEELARQRVARGALLYRVDLDASGERGHLTIAFAIQELRRAGGPKRTSPIALTLEDAERFAEPEDRALVGTLLGSLPEGSYESRAPGAGAERGHVRCRIGPALYDSLLPRLAATGRFGWARGAAALGDDHPLEWDDAPPWRFELELGDDALGGAARLEGWLVRDGTERRPVAEPLLVLGDGLVVFEDHLARFEPPATFAWVAQLRRQGAIRIPSSERDAFLEALWEMPDLPPLRLSTDLRWESVHVAPRPRLALRSTDAARTSPLLLGDLTFAYGRHVVPVAATRTAVVDRDAAKVFVRDRARERDLRRRLDLLGFRPGSAATGGGAPHDVALPRKDFVRAVTALVGEGWRIEAEGEPLRAAGAWKVTVSSGMDWFDVVGDVDFDGIAVPFPEVLEHLRRGERFVRLGDGTRGILPEEWLERYAPLAALGRRVETPPGEEGPARVRFTRSQAAFLDALLAARPEVEVDAVFARVREELARFRSVEPEPEPPGFAGSLRDYQREGLGWLAFLERFGLGGCLADDMGLGKTVQVIALLARRRAALDEGDLPRRPALVVAPRSLVFNWIDEAERFAPHLRVLDYTGAERAGALERLGEVDLAVTTYGTVRRDVAALEKVPFDYVILDEAQAIKNPASQSAKACRLLDARHRLALSGTPVENHIGELWSIFEFLNPGILGRLPGVRRVSTAGGPEDEADPSSLDLIARGLKPFILRRTKEQVLTELPQKTEQTLTCGLSGRQRKLYDELRDHYRASLGTQIQRVGLAKARFHVLEALLRLRQAACHPGLVDPGRVGEPSAKIDALFEQLEDVLAGGHKALVFSQFTSLLKIVRDRLDRDGIAYEYLDGRTRNREEHVARFQGDPALQLFLISLKAGGQGLNLTAADYVFILDPWWNPAVEAQAVDRTHRIGQERPVFAYRLICRDTVEEKIVELKHRKRSLADALVEADRKHISELTAEDIQLLLS